MQIKKYLLQTGTCKQPLEYITIYFQHIDPHSSAAQGAVYVYMLYMLD